MEHTSGVPTGVVRDELFAGIDWDSQVITDTEFEACTFDKVSLVRTTLQGCRFLDCRFANSDLSLIRPVDTLLGGCFVEDSRLLGIDWTLARWPAVGLAEPNVFQRCDVSMSTFAGLHLEGLQLENCRAHDTSFREAHLARANLSGTDCLGADFTGADLSGARLVDTRHLFLDPTSTRLQGAVVDPVVALQMLSNLGVTVETESENQWPDDARP